MWEEWESESRYRGNRYKVNRYEESRYTGGGRSGKRSSLGTTKARRAAGALPQFDCVGFHRECAQGRRSQGDGEVKRLHAGTPSGSYTGSEIRSGEADSGSGGQARYCYVQVRFFEEACLTGGHSNVLIKHRDQKIDSFR